MSLLLVVDDEEAICWALREFLVEAGHEVLVASSAEKALQVVGRRKPEAVMLDVRLPGMDGIAAMQTFVKQWGPTPIVVMTAFGDLETAVRALAGGAFDYLPKPFDLEQAAAAVGRALKVDRGARGASTGKNNPPTERLLGSSAAMQEVFKRIALVAPSDAAVLITGESGTGKELVARAIHRHSPRAGKPLTAINLAALSPISIESELFGHEPGAFAGAETARRGLLELANEGTVLFDEASDIPPSVQVKLLRVLEHGEVTPVGGVGLRPAAFRVITATTRDLRKQCAAGEFRQDLYFRLAVFAIELPPLRRRLDDIPALADYFLQRFLGTAAAPPIPAETLAELQARDWPGNVRELRNAVEHAALLARGGPILPELLPLPSTLDSAVPRDSSVDTLRNAVRDWTKERIAIPREAVGLHERFLSAAEPTLFEVVLEHTLQNRAAAADLLGIHRATLRKKLGERGEE